VSDWPANLADWMEHHSGIAAWAQAVGATLAVIAAVLVPALQARHARQQLEADRRLRAKSLAIAIYPELLHIRVAHRLIRRRLQELTGRRAGDHPSRSAISGAELADESKRLTIPITDVLRGLVPSFYLLGEPIGPQVQKCIGRSMKYNDLLNGMFGLATVRHLPRLQAFIDSGLRQVETCIAGIEQTWQIAPDDPRAFEDELAAPVDPEPLLEPETNIKETV
jgi:hypothetical protein